MLLLLCFNLFIHLRLFFFFPSYWSLGQILSHMPQSKYTDRRELRPLLTLRTAFHWKCTGYGVKIYSLRILLLYHTLLCLWTLGCVWQPIILCTACFKEMHYCCFFFSVKEWPKPFVKFIFTEKNHCDFLKTFQIALTLMIFTA